MLFFVVVFLLFKWGRGLATLLSFLYVTEEAGRKYVWDMPWPPAAECNMITNIPKIPDCPPGPLRSLPLTLGLQSQMSNALQVDARIRGLLPRLSLQLTVYPPRLPPCVRINSESESHTCHTQL